MISLFVCCKEMLYSELYAACCVVQKMFVIFTFSEHHVEEVVKLIRSVAMCAFDCHSANSLSNLSHVAWH